MCDVLASQLKPPKNDSKRLISWLVFGFFAFYGFAVVVLVFFYEFSQHPYNMAGDHRSPHLQVLCAGRYFGLPLRAHGTWTATTRGTIERYDVRTTGRNEQQKAVRICFVIYAACVCVGAKHKTWSCISSAWISLCIKCAFFNFHLRSETVRDTCLFTSKERNGWYKQERDREKVWRVK